MPQRGRALATAWALFAVAGCGARAAKVHVAAPGARGGAPSSFTVSSKPRWFPVVDEAEPRLLEVDADGSARVVERGLRLVEHADGRLERAEALLPDGPLGALSLPPRLGGGFVFYSV